MAMITEIMAAATLGSLQFSSWRAIGNKEIAIRMANNKETMTLFKKFRLVTISTRLIKFAARSMERDFSFIFYTVSDPISMGKYRYFSATISYHILGIDE